MTLYYKCRSESNHPMIAVDDSHREFYCEFCHKIYVKSECFAYELPTSIAPESKHSKRMRKQNQRKLAVTI